MGTCYSCQARIGKPTYPSDMSLTSDSSSKKGSHRLTSNAFTGKEKSSRLRPPAGLTSSSRQGSGSSSAEKLNSSGESGIVLTVENTQQKLYKKNQNANQSRTQPNSSGPRRSKFGFQQKPKATKDPAQRADANRNLMATSSDSLDSIDSKRSASSTSGRFRTKDLNCCRAYNPKEGIRWKMIDDSESTDTKSLSTQGRSEHDLDRDRNGNALTPTRGKPRTPKKLPVSSSSSNNNSSSNGNGSRLANTGMSKLPSRLRAPKQQNERQWVKAGALEMEEHKATSVDRLKSPQEQPSPAETASSPAGKKRRGLFTRGRGKLQYGGDRQGKEDNNKQKHVTPDSGLGDTLVEDEISKTVETMLEGNEKKDMKETINVLSKDIASVSLSDGEELTTPEDEENNKPGELLTDEKLSSSDDMLDDIDAYLEAAPRVRLDSLETCSLSSINSDDLMLETDMTDDAYNQSTCSLDKTRLLGTTTTKTRTQPRSNSTSEALSMSQPAGGLAKLDKRPFLRRADSSGYWRQGNVKGAAEGPRERRLRTQSSTSEAVNELSSMMGASGPPPAIQRRPPKFSRERPASFPGPLSADGGSARAERPVQFRQRGKAPSIGDEEQVLVDASTYRAIMQELTDCKTMVFKLKRVIQQEEIGSPFGNHTFAGTLKNGYNKFGGNSSTPGSPMVGLDASNNFAFTEVGDSKVTDVMQENEELRQQLQAMQRQLDDQDRTIKLLQQQMTKYECGHYGSEGKVFSNATTQTDKPRLAVPKNVLRPSAGGVQVSGAGGASAGGEPVISSRRLSNPKEDQDAAAASSERPAKPKSQLPVGSGMTRIQRGAGNASRLPSMRIQRYSKGQPQLQSFTKIAQAQPAN